MIARWRDPRVALLIVLAACAWVLLPRLGDGGLHHSEGHRVIPGWTMLQTGDWLVPTMFETPYLRKPPGMPWAVAASAAIFGESVWSARLVSVLAMTAMAVAAWWFARRFFGEAGGLAAGLAQILTPWFWESGRAAEIEALNNLGAQLACLGALGLLLTGRRLAAVGWGVGLAITLFAKGPAALPVVGAVVAVGLLLGAREDKQRALRRGAVLTAAGAPAVGLFVWWAAAARAQLEASGRWADAVLQSPGSFLWSEPVWEIAVLPVVVWLSAMPAGLALLFPWGPDARAELRDDAPDDARGFTIARALAFGFVLAALGFAVFGVGNPRYLLPAAPLLPPLVGYAVWRLETGITPKRGRIARLMLLGRGWVWPIVLGTAAALYWGSVEPQRRVTSGRDPGRALGKALAVWVEETGRNDVRGALPEVVVFADDAIEARPETLWSMRAAFEERATPRKPTAVGEDYPLLRVIWTPNIEQVVIPKTGVILALCDESDRSEWIRIQEVSGTEDWRLIATERVHKYLMCLVVRDRSWLLDPASQPE